MTGPTHKQYSICFGCLAVMLCYNKELSQVNYYLALIIVLMTAKAGALFPDVDHAWVNVHNKTIINKIINTLIHVTGGKHRSWQTHSWDICIIFSIFSYFLPNYLYNVDKISIINKEIATLVLFGFSSGWISHLFSDMLTSAGVRVLCFIKFYARFVPRQILGFKFNTGNEWEAFNYKVIKIINIMLGTVCILYPLI